jgi:hypothetical protein
MTQTALPREYDGHNPKASLSLEMAPDTGYLVPARVISSVCTHPYEVGIYITWEKYISNHFKILPPQYTKTSNTCFIIQHDFQINNFSACRRT